MKINESLTLISAIILAFVIILGIQAFSGGEQQTPVEYFNGFLSHSSVVYIVMDISGAPNPLKRNIMQCGVDFSGSIGAYKKIVPFVVDENNCYSVNGSISIPLCMSQIHNSWSDVGQTPVIIYIHSGNETKYIKNEAIVGVDETYMQGDCSVSVKK